MSTRNTHGSITRFSAPEGLLLPKDIKLEDPNLRERLMHFLASSGVAPLVMAPDVLTDITPSNPGTAKNNYMVTTGPGNEHGEPEEAAIHIMPRTSATMNHEIGGDHLRQGQDMDTPRGEGVSYSIPGQVGGFPLLGPKNEGLAVYEFITAVRRDEISALGRIAAFAQQR